MTKHEPPEPPDAETQPRLPYDPYEHVRVDDPDTSRAAAYSLTQADVTEVQRRVLAILGHHPEGLTDEELLHEYMRDHVTAESSPRKRRHDLTQAGFIADTGQRRPLVSGRHGIVWKLVARSDAA
jgi:hypothetical protein